MEAVVEFDYIAQEPDELTLHKGDILHNINPQPGGWWEGTLNDKRGMFPDNFIQIVDKDSDVTYRHRNKVKRQCRAIFSYSAVHDDELSLNVGEVIDILGEVEEGWWRGQLNDKEGVFPSNFVQEIHIAAPLSAHRQKKVVSSKEDLTSIAGETDQNVPSLPPKPVKILCQVQYPYEACNDDELTLRVGDVITLISKDGQDKGWWRGELRGQVGVFPDNFVTVITLSSDASKQNTDKKPDRPPSSKISPGQLPGIKKEIVTRPIPNVVVQRKSLEVKSESPPIPGKKPTVPIKKSPSLTGSTGGIFSGLKQKVIGLEHKILDSTDGIGSSKPPLPKEEQPIVQKEEQPSDKHNEFDQVERSGLLSDPRANRAKAPGRRPPSMVLRDADPGMTNGNVEHPMSITPIIDENLETDNKRKQRDWEKHRAPWMDELKLNQAKKTSPLNPSPDSASRLKFTSPSEQSHLKLSNEKLDSHDETGLDSSKSKPDNEMTKSMSAITSRIRNSTPELPEIVKTGVSFRARNSLNQSVSNVPVSIRPQSIHGDSKTPGDLNKTPPGSIIRNQSPSPLSKPPTAEKYSPALVDRKYDSTIITNQQYNELEERVKQLEAALEKQQQIFNEKIEEMSEKLKSEIEIRQQLQTQIDKLEQCVTQV